MDKDKQDSQVKTPVWEKTLNSKSSKRLGDLSLIKSDLTFCLRVMRNHSIILKDDKANDLRRAVWIAIIVKFSSCFASSGSRSHLDPKSVFKTQKHYDVYKFIEDLRNNHVAHDKNLYYQERVVAAFDEHNDVLAVMGVSIISDFNNHLYKYMLQLLRVSLKFVEEEIYRCGIRVSKETQSLTDDKKLSLLDFSFEANTLDPSRNRKHDSKTETPAPIPHFLMQSGRVSFPISIELHSALRIKEDWRISLLSCPFQTGSISFPISIELHSVLTTKEDWRVFLLNCPFQNLPPLRPSKYIVKFEYRG